MFQKSVGFASSKLAMRYSRLFHFLPRRSSPLRNNKPGKGKKSFEGGKTGLTRRKKIARRGKAIIYFSNTKSGEERLRMKEAKKGELI